MMAGLPPSSSAGSFTVEKYLYLLPDEQSEWLFRIRDILLSAHPEMTEKITFGSPFFSCRSWLCYFNPLKDGGLEIGFCKGHALQERFPELVARGRKAVSSLYFESPAQFDESLFRRVLAEAIMLNLQKKKRAVHR